MDSRAILPDEAFRSLERKLSHACGTPSQIARLSILIRIGHALSANLELGPLLDTVYREVGRVFDTTDFFIALHRQGSEKCTFALDYRSGEKRPVVSRSDRIGLTGYILRTGKALFFPTVAVKQAFLEREHVVSYGVPAKSWMGVPLTAGEQVVGVMAIQNYEREEVYSEEDLELFSAIASSLAVAVRNAQLYEDERRRAREMEIIAAVGRDLTSSLDLEGVMNSIVAYVRSLLTSDLVVILFEDAEDGLFKTMAACGPYLDALKKLQIRRGHGLLGSILQSERPEIVNDASGDPRTIHIPGTPPNVDGEKIMAVPVFSNQRVVGVLAVWRAPEEPLFDPADLIFLEGIGRQASVAILNAQLYGQVQSALAEAKTASQAKSSFLANMSHELRTPLNAILLYSELLQEDAHGRGLEDLAGDLERIQGAGRHLLGLIDGILDLSKIEAGCMTVYLEDCDVASLAVELSDTMQPLVAKNQNRLVVEIDPALGRIRTDHCKLRQILLNLLGNAAKFTRDGTIWLRATRVPDQVCFQVADTGVGLTPEQTSRIFQEFYQAEDSTYRKFGGTGLGLTLCHKFVQLLGGEISVESQAGEGSTFQVRLPGAVLKA